MRSLCDAVLVTVIACKWLQSDCQGSCRVRCYLRAWWGRYAMAPMKHICKSLRAAAHWIHSCGTIPVSSAWLCTCSLPPGYTPTLYTAPHTTHPQDTTRALSPAHRTPHTAHRKRHVPRVHTHTHCTRHLGAIRTFFFEHGYKEWGNFVRGQVREENFIFQFGAEIFPTVFFGSIWGASRSLCILSGGGSQVLLRCCRQSVCLSRSFIFVAWE